MKVKSVISKIKYIVLVVAAVIAASMFCGCSADLTTPTQLTLNKTSMMLTWTPIENATAYIVEVDDAQYASSNSEFSLSFLGEGNHSVRVKARDARNNYNDSSWSEPLAFYKEYESGMVYTLTNGNTEYEITRIGTARGDIVIEDEYRGKPVTSIAARAFYSNGGVKSVKIGKNVKRIGSFAFTNCSNLESVELPDGLTDVGESVFQGCAKLTSVKLPEELTEIGLYMFRFCRRLESVTLGSKVSVISEAAFCDCDKLTSVVLPASVKTIDKQAFRSCDSLASVDLGEVKEIGESAFEVCINLNEVKGGSALEIVGVKAFYNCDSLASFTFGDAVASIGNEAFAQCDKLESVVIGKNVTSIGIDAFVNTALYENNIADGIIYADKWVIGYNKDITQARFKSDTVGIANAAMTGCNIMELALPSSMRYIGSEAFYMCGSLTTLDIGSGVTHIGRYAFYGCQILGRGYISLGTNVVEIGSNAFRNCPDFGNPAYTQNRPITIPKTVKVIGTQTFVDTNFWKATESGVVYVDKWAVGFKDSKDSLDDVTIKDGTVGIGNYAFANSKSLATVAIPASIEIVGSSAFYQCENLARVYMDALIDLPEIGDYAFYKCKKLLEVDIPVSVDRIGRSAFYQSGIMVANIPKWVKEIGPFAYFGCEDLIEVNFESGSLLQKIEEKAFANCIALPKISIPDSVTSIGDRVFSKCEKLTSVTFGNGLTDMGSYVFNSCTALTDIVLPDSLTRIPEKTFYRCSALSKVTFGKNTESIGDYAFFACALTDIDLPESVRDLGDYAFRNNRALTSVTIGGKISSIGDHVFNGCSNLTVYTDSESASEEWSPRWNSAFRPVVWGCTLDETGKYVVSFVKSENSISNITAKNGISAPKRSGYVFGGWLAVIDSSEKIFGLDELESVPNGTILTAVWNEETTPVNPPAADSGENEQ